MDNFSGLPEDCMSLILSKTSPRDLCRLSVVSSVFQLATQSDAVWDSFLPSREYISKSNFDQPSSFNLLSSKKDLFFRLCRGLATFLDEDNPNFKVIAKLDQSSGKISCTLQSTSLSLFTMFPRNFACRLSPPQPNVRFKGVCLELKLRGSSLRFHAKLNTRHMLSPNTTYSVYFIFDFYDRHDLPGFIKVSLKFSSQNGKTLSESKFRTNLERAWGYEGGGCDGDDNGKAIITKGEDGFRELKLGEFYNGGNDGGIFEMSLKQDETMVFFLSFLSIEFRPK